jgi:hypothetical protein
MGPSQKPSFVSTSLTERFVAIASEIHRRGGRIWRRRERAREREMERKREV